MLAILITSLSIFEKLSQNTEWKLNNIIKVKMTYFCVAITAIIGKNSVE